MKRGLLAAALALLLAPAALPYYHFVRFLSRSGPFQAIFDRFDVNSLPDRTIPFVVTDAASARLVLASRDSYNSVLSQIRAAAQVWNGVPSADVRVGFAGVLTPGTAMTTPAIEVLFDELPDGVIGMGGPVVRGDTAQGPNGLFTPIVRSQVILPRNFTRRPSWSESFYLTAAHEFGHALGLQHTYTSSLMSTEITRGVTKGKPLGSDDIAGLSVLYPGQTFRENTGSISGRVSISGAGVHLASVVALTPSRGAVSTLTNPDGSYRLEGLTPGAYFLYVHPLPPAYANEVRPGNPVNLELPSDAAGAIAPGPGFDTVFWPGSRAPQQSVVVNSATDTPDINFPVQRRDRVSIFGVQTYSYYTSVPIKPAHVQNRLGRGLVIMAGSGLISNRAVAPGLGVSLLESHEQVASGSVRPYSSAPDSYLQLDVLATPFSAEGARHLVFSSGSETYVLPSAVTLVDRPAPSFSMLPYPDGTLQLAGQGLGPGTQVWFDGVPAAVRLAEAGRVVVAPPPAPVGHTSVIAAYNSDGQSSLFVMTADDAAYQHSGGEAASTLSVAPAVLPAGVETMVEITGSGLTLADPSTLRLGFGSSDVVVRRVWVAGPNRILANVYVAPNATPGVLAATLTAGLNLYSAPSALALMPSAGRQPWVALSQTPAAQAVTPGASVTLTLAGLQGSLQGAALSVTINDRAVSVLAVNGNQVTLQVPASAALGAAVVRITVNGETVLPIVLGIESPAPVIREVYGAGMAPVDLSRPARAGETLTLIASNLPEINGSFDTARLKLATGALEHVILGLAPVAQQPGLIQVQFTLSPQTPVGVLPLTLSLDGRASAAFGLAVRAQ
jgi:uncharacterized protein (TIGR03437 family)